MEQQPHRVFAAKATELNKIFQVFVKNHQGKSITINNVTSLTSVEDLKLKVKDKTEMRGVWPELKYRSGRLHAGKTLSAYGIDQCATLEMTWLLLGGGPTHALVPDTGAATSHTMDTTGSTIFQLDENNVAELGPRSRSVSPSITVAHNHEEGAIVHAAHKPMAAFVNKCAAQQQDATDSHMMAERSGHGFPRIMDACNVESLEDYDERVVDALPHNMEASKVDSAAVNGANALEASLSLEGAGAFAISPCVLRTATVAFTHARSQKLPPTRAHHLPSAHA
jgi:hypothetical protein